MKSIRYLFILACTFWILHLRASGYDICWAQVFKIGSPVSMLLVSPTGYPLGYSIHMLLGLSLEFFFGTLEVSLVGVSLGPLSGFMVGTGEIYLVGLSLGLPLVYPLDSTDTGMTGIIL